ncbi:membrane bound cation transporter, putative [Trichophyton benhamiae CBS 112371]|uniref:Membrane bound cation transporter, putative n=1 Tax=Arthroderma benhamiae (strain ATCC MYA-4681 / CBS 112371) TaxID=663331 RepID=D4B3E7_ARTBC|nr:membrane bound cation transporter, putative [Trichophyton benhamiae CBS 112371]EFE29645.1 membrane bound cation transporter, putative [Trichophyton benhamiae CBS 112371]
MTDMERVKEPETMHGAVPSTAGTDGVQGGTESVTSTAPLTRAAGDIKADEQDVHRKSGGSESVDKQQETTPREDAPAAGHAKQFTVAGQLRATLFSSWINILLVAAPAGIIMYYLKVNSVAVFVVNFIAIVPLAAMLGYGTEEIAMRTGETVGGLLNATFGNAVELIVSILALFKNEIVIVQTSLIGSILSNLLLVMGMSFFVGGVTRMEQNFNVTVAQTASSLLALAVGSLIIPTAFHTWSGSTSVILLVVYGAYLFFQLKSHASIFNTPSEKVEKRSKSKKVEDGDASKGIAQIGAGFSASMGGQNAQHIPVVVPEEEEEPQLSIYVAVFTLCASTALVALCAEAMVSSIDAITTSGGISETFVGLILLPIVGNAAEHATAVTVAAKDKMDLSIGVAVGSSMQIALLVLPLLVVIGWIAGYSIIGKDDMTLYFDGFQVTVLFVTVLLVNYLIQDGKSHWLEGVQLMTLYIIISVAAW